MKTNRIYVKLVTVLTLLLSLKGFSQPDYVFRNATLISGTARQEGAKYRFNNIKPGVDGIITITDLNRITLDDIDGGSGFDEAFQPVINVPRRTNGYVEFQLDFVNRGTEVPRLMVEVPLTAIDIDGYVYPDEKIYEFDEFKTSPVCFIAYDFIGSALDVKFQGAWVDAVNKTARDYAGVDTVQRDVMFSMVHAGVTSITFRVGADNKSRTDAQRLRSVYFKKFLFANSAVLSQSPVINFNGKKEKNTTSLTWKFNTTMGITKYELERSVNGKDFTTIATANLNGYENADTYTFNDVTTESIASYRVKTTNINEKVTYSQVIYFRDNDDASNNKMNIFPNVIRSSASVQVKSAISEKTYMQVVDYSGNVVYKTAVILNKGTNSLNLDISGKLAKGNYVVVLPINGVQLTEKIVVN
jgi:hypothetical protein